MDMLWICSRLPPTTKGGEKVLKVLTFFGHEQKKSQLWMNDCNDEWRKRAHEWMRRMLDAGVRPDIANFNSAIDACARSGDIAGAEQWLSKMLANGMEANTVTHNAVINACAQAGIVPRAQWWMRQLCEKGKADVSRL